MDGRSRGGRSSAGMGGADGSMGGVDNGMGGRGGGGRGGGGMDASSMETPSSAPSFKFTVRWMSASLMQQAMQRANGGGKTPTPDSAVDAPSSHPMQSLREPNAAERPHRDVTELLLSWRQGDRIALDQLIPLVYDELHRLARGYFRREHVGPFCSPPLWCTKLSSG